MLGREGETPTSALLDHSDRSIARHLVESSFRSFEIDTDSAREALTLMQHLLTNTFSIRDRLERVEIGAIAAPAFEFVRELERGSLYARR